MKKYRFIEKDKKQIVMEITFNNNEVIKCESYGDSYAALIPNVWIDVDGNEYVVVKQPAYPQERHVATVYSHGITSAMSFARSYEIDVN
ncbi:hypothetical protein CAI16_05485 [Virgibacillus dokdonensis]|uniref:Uncharacterized protein n=1 Tax=Virgibacillus dokdonensis TaxID=302167 RepID=A0A3E0WVP5_9BACI|nr:hypothetical protein [Virgibacillus dokdonensis]RFA36241.1 hypothetical protein CAI16_05485 [Virgibacillus dokdonensis]